MENFTQEHIDEIADVIWWIAGYIEHREEGELGQDVAVLDAKHLLALGKARMVMRDELKRRAEFAFSGAVREDLKTK